MVDFVNTLAEKTNNNNSNNETKRGNRLIVVSNRLPISIKRFPTKSWDVKLSSGGLVASLEGLKQKMKFIWIGWPGVEVEEKERPTVNRICLDQHSAVPVYMTNELAELHYNGFSNEILWPLFHYLIQDIEFDPRYWEAYKEANQKFAHVVMQQYREGDLIWVHDYHLTIKI